MRTPFLIGIAGPSCSGKTQLASGIAERLGKLNTTLVAMDSYYLDLGHLSAEERAIHNFDHPNALDWSLLREHVSILKSSSPIRSPVYDFNEHVRKPGTNKIRPAKWILVEGLFALYDDELRGNLDVGIFVEASDKVCLARRIKRDVSERGRTPESVMLQFAKTVQPMAKEFIWPSRKRADFTVNGELAIQGLIEATVQDLINRLSDKIDC